MKGLFSAFIFLLSFFLALFPVESKEKPCPHFLVQDGPDLDNEPDHVPTTPYQSECRLHRDVNGLVETLQLDSDITLNCQGHKITPSASGVLGDRKSRSVPELAIFLHQVSNAQVKDCKIGDFVEGRIFDHGILVANSKAPVDRPIQITHNEIDARFLPVHVVQSDHVVISDENHLTWRTQGGAGILTHVNSDYITIAGNDITAAFPPTIKGAFLMPGTLKDSNPELQSANGAVIVAQTLGAHPMLFTAVVGGKVYQFKAALNPQISEEFPGDTLVEDNIILYDKNSTTEDGIVVSNALRTVIRGNTVGDEEKGSNLRQAIRAGLNVGPRSFSGKCSGKSERDCLGDLDCNIPGVDIGNGDTCKGVTVANINWRSRKLTYEDNTVYGGFLGAALAGTAEQVTIQNNTVLGAFPSGKTAGFGITLAGKYPLEGAVVSRNKISNVATGLNLIYNLQETPSVFGAKIWLNDITGYDTAVQTSNDYVLASELSVDEQGNVCNPNSSICLGNYWGLACPGFDKSLVKGGGQGAVVDSNPFEVKIADLAEEDFPETCEAP